MATRVRAREVEQAMAVTTRDTLVFLLAGGQGERLYPLTRDRAKPAVPFGGHYRIIDFTLTNCVHSELRRIFVMTQYRSLSLERHVKRGFQFLPRELGEFIDTVPPQFRSGSSWYAGTADAVYQNIDLMQAEKPKRLLVLSGDHVYRLDYRLMAEDHERTGAAMTIGVIEVPVAEATRMGVLEVDRSMRVVGFQEKPKQPKEIPGRPGVALASMGIYLFETETLVREVMWDAKRESTHDFGKDVVPHMVETGQRVYAFPLRDKNGAGADAGYWRDVGTIDAYFDAHTDVLGKTPKFDLRDRAWPIFSVSSRLPPAEVRSDGSLRPDVVDSVLADGVVVAGASVHGSILGVDTVVGPGAELEDCILLGRTVIGPGAKMKKVVVDHDVVIPKDFVIGHDAKRDAEQFLRSPGGICVIGQGTRFD
jgi:glucose-1-phosphate adenylyltransferase